MNVGAELLCDFFASEVPFLIGKNGTVELEVLLSKPNEITTSLANKLELHAGVFPSSHLENWRLDYLDALVNTDILAEAWYKPFAEKETTLLDTLKKDRKKILLRNIEPYYVEPELRWSKYLASKRVAIISSFAQTCEEQTYMAKAIWGNEAKTILPNSTTWIPIQTYYGPKVANGNAQWPYATNYREAIRDVVERTLEQRPNIAIIGCGGLGMIIGSQLKNAGIQCIVMGGATQIMFGVRGKRWENHEIISTFFNDAWVFPPKSCIPRFAKQIEGGCYW
jgi:hypothetical protein